MSDSEAPYDYKLVACQLLEAKMLELKAVQARYNQLLYASDIADEVIDQELASDDIYKTNYLSANIKISKLTLSTTSVVEWLLFWSQFIRTHEKQRRTY